MFLRILNFLFQAYRMLLPVIKGNRCKSGRLVFLCSQLSEVRNAVSSLKEVVDENLKYAKQPEMHATLVHIFPKVGTGMEKSQIFGYIEPEVLAKQVLEGIQNGMSDIYIPGFMHYLGFWSNFLPKAFVDPVESLLYGDKD